MRRVRISCSQTGKFSFANWQRDRTGARPTHPTRHFYRRSRADQRFRKLGASHLCGIILKLPRSKTPNLVSSVLWQRTVADDGPFIRISPGFTQSLPLKLSLVSFQRHSRQDFKQLSCIDFVVIKVRRYSEHVAAMRYKHAILRAVIEQIGRNLSREFQRKEV